VNLLKRTWRIRLILLSIMVLLVWLTWSFLPPPTPPPFPGNYRAQKAVWMDITWSMDAHTEGEIQALAEKLQAHRITYVFAYTSYLKADDVFNPTFEHAKTFTAKMHDFAPEIKLLAWVGVPINLTTTTGETITNRLADTRIQSTIADFSQRVVEEFGFDGLHLNAEPISDGSEAFISTLQAIRSELPEGAILSLAAQALHPTEAIVLAQYPKTDYRWSNNYLKRVAENSDQIAIMAYDSGLFLPSDYRSWMAYQTRTSADILAEVDSELLIGVPASEEWTLSHNITTEYLANALYGVQLGISQTAHYAVIDGIAIYPDWEVSDAEWVLVDNFS
jgi:hypothetical protein